MLMMSRAAQIHLAGLMRPSGRVFETPALEGKEKELALINWVKLTQDIGETCDVACLLKVGRKDLKAWADISVNIHYFDSV